MNAPRKPESGSVYRKAAVVSPPPLPPLLPRKHAGPQETSANLAPTRVVRV